MRGKLFRIAALAVSLTILALLILVFAQNTAAQGPIEPPVTVIPPYPPPPVAYVSQAYIQSHQVNVTVQDQVAVTTIKQVFVNDGQRPAEGTYLFPLPAGAALPLNLFP